MASQNLKNLRLLARQSGVKRLRTRPVRWLPPDTVERKYVKALLALCKRAENAALAAVRALPLRKDDLSAELSTVDDRVLEAFGSWAEMERIAMEVAAGVNAWNREQFYRVIKSVVGVNPFSTEPWLNDVLRVAVKANTDLIKALSSQASTQVGQSALEAVRNGTRAADLEADIVKRFGAARSRAKLIARDQVAKLNADLAHHRQTDLGIKHYVWRSSEDERVRPSHAYNNNRRFSWADAPSTGHPGRDFQCRCYAEPDIEELMGPEEDD